MKKCIIAMAASQSENFEDGYTMVGSSTGKFFTTTLADGTEILVPIFEVETETTEELKKEINKIVDRLVNTL
jgi:hypothetical protein